MGGIGEDMSPGEAKRLVDELAGDPTSRIATALGDFDRPWSFEWQILADFLDAYAASHFKRPKPYPRPWRDPNSRRRGRTTKSRAEVIEILNAHGHNIGGDA